MRKLVLYINSTFNGVVTGDPKEDKTNFMIWTTPESVETGSAFLVEIMESVDTILYGRGTYEDLVRKWPNIKDWGDISDTVANLGDKINNAHKLVVTGSRPLDNLTWGEFEAPTQLTGTDITDQIKELKNGTGGDILIIGSPMLVRSLADADLIDLYHINVRPVVVNVGEHLFDNLKERKDFTLVEARPQEDGSIIVSYAPAKANQ